MTAMDHIWADPRLSVSYRIGSLKTRVISLDAKESNTEAELMELECYREEIDFLEHIRTVLSEAAR